MISDSCYRHLIPARLAIILAMASGGVISPDLYAFDKHKSNTIMTQNGKTISKFGNGLKDSDGTVYQKYGTSIRDSNGEIWQLFGNTIKRKSDGKSCRVFGNSIKCK